MATSADNPIAIYNKERLMFRIRNGILSGLAILVLLMMVSSNTVAQTSTRVVDLLWNATGQLIATVDYLGAVTVVNATQQTVFISANNGFGTRIAWDPTSPERLAVSTLRQGITLFNVLSGVVEAQFDTDANTYSVSFSPDGRFLLTSHGTPGDGPLGKGSIHIVEIATGNDRAIYEEVQQRVTMARWSPDGNRIGGLNVGDVGEVVIWDANTGAVIERLSEAEETTDSELGTYVTGSVSSFDWSSDGEILALGAELDITFWDSVAYTHIGTSDYLFVIEDIDWRPNEPVIAVASGYDRQIQLVDVISGQIVEVIPTSFDVLAVSWSPDGSQLAFSGITNLVLQVVDVPSLVIPSLTPTFTATFTSTPTPTFTPTVTFTATPTPTATFTPTYTPMSTFTSTFTPTNTPTSTFTPTPTFTVTFTPTPSVTCTATAANPSALVSAMNAANTNGASADTICLTNSTYSFLSAANSVALPSVTTPITIVGNGGVLERGSGAPQFRLFNVTASGTLTLQNMTVRNFHAGGGNGGAILNAGSLALDSATLTNNTARYGGAIHSSGTLTIINSTLSSNSANENAGAIYLNSGTLTISDTTLQSNSARYGSGIYMNNGTVNLTNVTMLSNSVTEQGAGVYQRTGTLMITGGLFESNMARFGNGVYVDAGAATINGAVMQNNTATEEGGAIYNRTGTVSVSGSTFDNNRGRYGAAISNRGPFTIANSMFSGNIAVESGGAVYNTSNASANRIQNTCFSGNTARFGGAVFSSTGSFNARDNWWGAATGPTTAMVNSNVQFTPFLTSGCPN